MADKIVGKSDKIPEDSRCYKYLKEMKTIFENFDDAIFEEFLKRVFHDCLDFVVASGIKIPLIKFVLVYNSDQYIELEKQFTKTTISEEIAKGPSTAFVVHSGVLSRMYFNIGKLFESIQDGYPSFILNLVNTYIHEILHSALPSKNEQEIYDLECKTVEDFLEIKLPKEFKNLKASDYYK